MNSNRIDLLRVLTTKIRVAWTDQLATAVPGWNLRLIRAMVREGSLHIATQSLRVVDVSDIPLASWHPPQVQPDIGRISYLGKRRIRDSESQTIQLVWASRAATQIVGGIGGRLRQPWQVQHDLGVSSVFFSLRRASPSAADEWISEDIYRRDVVQDTSEKIADGFCMSGGGTIRQVYEFVGDYSAARLREFHQYWSARQIPYEWR